MRPTFYTDALCPSRDSAKHPTVFYVEVLAARFSRWPYSPTKPSPPLCKYCITPASRSGTTKYPPCKADDGFLSAKLSADGPEVHP